MNIELTVEFDHRNHTEALNALGAGGYCGGHESIDDCHYRLTVPNGSVERMDLIMILSNLMTNRIKFELKYT